jgi:hypothetical protein
VHNLDSGPEAVKVSLGSRDQIKITSTHNIVLISAHHIVSETRYTHMFEVDVLVFRPQTLR